MPKIVVPKERLNIFQTTIDFDKACAEAGRRAFDKFEIDEYCNSKKIDWVRSTDSLHVKFKGMEQQGGMGGFEYYYRFEIWTTRMGEDEL